MSRGWLWKIPAPDGDGLSIRQRVSTHEDSTAQLVPFSLPISTLQSESRLQFLWPSDVDERSATPQDSCRASGPVRTAEQLASWTEQLLNSQLFLCDTAIIGLLEHYYVSHDNESPFNI